MSTPEIRAADASDVPLPPGADLSRAGGDDWQPAHNGKPSYRLVWSKDFEECLGVRAVVTQYRDGTIATGYDDAPLVYIGADDYLPDDARNIADSIRAAANLADAWSTKRDDTSREQPGNATGIQPPPGSTVESDWAYWDGECRIVVGRTRTVGDVAEIYTSAQQNRNGEIETGGHDFPRVVMERHARDRGWTADEARQVAAVLIEAAAELDAWTRSMNDH